MDGRHTPTPVNLYSRLAPWIALAATAMAAWMHGTYAWRASWYEQGAWVAAGASIIAACWALKSVRWSWRAVAVVALVLLVANYSVVHVLVMLAFWSVSGFAP
jgi:hypothetical protein